VNHSTVKVPDLHHTSKFYQEFLWNAASSAVGNDTYPGVGKSFFGIEQGAIQPASVNHYDFGIENFDADAFAPG